MVQTPKLAGKFLNFPPSSLIFFYFDIQKLKKLFSKNMLQSKEIATPETTPRRLRHKTKKQQNCLICGKFSRFKYYNLQSCNGCKQFFRRIVLNRTQYYCLADGKCDLSKEKCRGCRLDKCLQLGMDSTSVHFKNQHSDMNRMLDSLELRRKELIGKSKMGASKKLMHGNGMGRWPQIFHNLERESNQIEYLTKILSAHKRIAQRCFDLPDEYLNKFSGIEEVLDGQENILSLAECYSPYFDRCSNAEIAQLQREMIQKGYGQMHPIIKKAHIVYYLMVVGILKAMPAFDKLSPRDKEILAHEIGHQLNNLTNAFYAMEMGEMSVTGPRGLSVIGYYENTCGDIPRIIQMAKIVFVHPMEAFRRISMLSMEEFALLVAIMCSNSAISGLSPHAKDLLYREQCHYSKLLLKHCQHKMGNEAKGAQRYGECLQLIECAFQAARNYELMNTYIEVFLTGKDFYEGVFPQGLKKLVK